MSAPNAPAERPLRHSPAGPVGVILTCALVAAVMLVVAEFTTIASVHVEGESCEAINDADQALADRCSLSGWERHGGALVLLALLAAGAGIAARVRTNAAIGASLLAIGIVTLGIALIADLPVTGDTGAIGTNFDTATARAGLGFYLELLGGLLCVAAGLLGLLTARRDRHAGAGTAPDARAAD